MILTNTFFWSRICSIFVILVLKRCHSIAKRLIFQNVKKMNMHPIVFVIQHVNVGLPFFIHTIFLTNSFVIFGIFRMKRIEAAKNYISADLLSNV